MSVLPIGISGEAGAYQIERSLRFNSADSAYLSRTFTTPTNNKKWSISMWVKRSALGANQALFSQGYDGSDYFDFRFNTSDQLYVQNRVGASNLLVANTTAVFRDVSAWYHLVFVFDSDNATAAYRNRLWMNNVEYTWSANSGSGNASSFNRSSTQPHVLGISQTLGTPGLWTALSGYMAEVHFIDGSALTPSSFGETDSDTGVWKPKAYSGSYGTNGFYLDFGDNSSTTALGYDAAGSNDWTPNNFSVTAGAGNDSLVDSPTRYGTDTGVGGEVRGNYATLNPLNASGTLANGNLDYYTTSNYQGGYATMPASGKIYFEVSSLNGTGGGVLVGFVKNATIAPGTTNFFTGSGFYGAVFSNTLNYYLNGSSDGLDHGNVTNNMLQFAVDAATGKCWVGSGGTWFDSGDPATGANPAWTISLSSGDLLFPAFCVGNSTYTISVNFGQRPFAYTAPSGFKALCTTNLPEPTIVDGEDYFNAVLYTGNSSTQTISGVGFQPDLIWSKSRSNSGYGNTLVDAVRGNTKIIRSNTTDAEGTYTDAITGFTSDGFTLGADASGQENNVSGQTYVAWNWKANGAGSSNTAGTISSTVSANTTAGFSIITYTGNGTSGATIGHGLGVAPSFFVVKGRSFASNWLAQHISVGNGSALTLNSTAAASASSTYWNNTSPSSTVITLGNGSETNPSGSTMVCYAFAPIAGYSAFGSFVGSGSADGPMIFCNFRPRYVLIKRSTGVDNWFVYDTARSTYNLASQTLQPNTSNAEDTTVNQIDILSNGFKCRSTNTATNQSGETYVYACFAENPMKFSLAR